jgi:hypothetical protein
LPFESLFSVPTAFEVLAGAGSSMLMALSISILRAQQIDLDQ